MNNFANINVGEILAKDRGISVGVMYPGDDTANGVPLIRVGDIVDRRINPKPQFRISKSVHKEYSRTALVGGECLITLVGRPGIAVVVPRSMAGWNAARALAVVRLENEEDNIFFVYSLAAPSVQNTIRNWCNTTVQATLNLKEIRALPIPWPERRERQHIAGVLSALDDKIELNRRMNETLEGMAQAIFKDWFVDFGPTRRKLAGITDPVAIMGSLTPDAARATELAALFPDALGEDGLPAGWKKATLAEIATLNDESWKASNHPDTVEYVDLSNTKWGVIESTALLSWSEAPSRARRIAKRLDTIVGTVRPGNGSYSFIARGGYTVSTGFAVLRPRIPAYAEVLYVAATSEENIGSCPSPWCSF